MLAVMGSGGSPDAISLGVAHPGPGSVSSRGDGSRVKVAGLLVATALALGCATALVAQPGASVPGSSPARGGLASLPAAAQGPVSAALGRDQQAYRLVGLRALNPAQRLRVGFSSRGVAVASGGARFSMALSAYGYAGALRPSQAATPRVSANRVSYDRGALSEWYANGPLGLEQGFDVGSRPGAGSGPLTFSLALSGNLAVRLQGGSLLLRGRGVSLRYDGLLATDARGRVLRSWLQLAGGHLLIRVDDRGASYPLRIDPFVRQAELTASGGATGDELGYSVAVSGNTVVAGARAAKVGANELQGAAYVFVMPAAGWASATQTAKLTASDGAAHDTFGSSVAISGATVVVGAPDAMVVHAAQGAAYVFTRPAGGWGTGSQPQHQAAKLAAKEGEEDDLLGSSVAISGATVVAGAPGAMVVHVAQGTAYVFTEPGGGWGSHKTGEELTQTAELAASDGATQARLGFSVAISGKTIVAGAYHAEVNTHPFQGAAYIFTEPGGGWGTGSQPQHDAAKLTASDGAPEDELGTSVAVSGATAVVGAPVAKVGANIEQGKAYVFTEPGGGWGSHELGEGVTQAAKLTASDGAPGDKLGLSVAASGTTVIAGAPEAMIGKNEFQGATYVFSQPAGGWSGELHQVAKLTASDGGREDELGSAVAISGQTALAGARRHQVGSNVHQGAAYVFGYPAPSVTITTPANGAVYTQGQVVDASYACSAPAGATVTACAGPVANGAALDTSALGAHAFTVETADSDGVGASQSVGYTVVPAPVCACGVPLLLGGAPTLTG